jgi:hypothetical protein
MDHHRPREIVPSLGSTVFEVESLGELEVELNCGTLVGPLERVLDRDVDFGAVEGTVAWVEVPFARLEPVEDGLELLIRGTRLVNVRMQVEGVVTFSAVFQVSISPKNFSGRVESSSLNVNPNMPYTRSKKLKIASISCSIYAGYSISTLESIRCAKKSKYLGRHTEYMRVILHKPAHAGQPCKCTACFVSVDNTKLGHPQRKLAVAPGKLTVEIRKYRRE